MPFEKIGGNDRDVNMMHEFGKAIRECDLVNLESEGWPVP